MATADRQQPQYVEETPTITAGCLSSLSNNSMLGDRFEWPGHEHLADPAVGSNLARDSPVDQQHTAVTQTSEGVVLCSSVAQVAQVNNSTASWDQLMWHRAVQLHTGWLNIAQRSSKQRHSRHIQWVQKCQLNTTSQSMGCWQQLSR